MLHYMYNKNSGSAQAETKTGDKRYSILYPKYKSGGYIVRKITKTCTYMYGKAMRNIYSPNYRKMCKIETGVNYFLSTNPLQ